MSELTDDERDETAWRYACVAADLVGRVCGDGRESPDESAAWLVGQITSAEWPAFAHVLAAMVQASRPMTELLGWVVDRLPLEERPAWVWAAAHEEFERLADRDFPKWQMPPGVVEGERQPTSANASTSPLTTSTRTPRHGCSSVTRPTTTAAGLTKISDPAPGFKDRWPSDMR